jgi:uncharacterized protein
VRTYAARETHPAHPDPDAAMDALVDVIVAKYAPLPERSLAELVRQLRHGAPQWDGRRKDALARARRRLPHADIDGARWVWPAGEDPGSARHRLDDELRLLAPFDPIVWDRRRFECFWGWAYRFEAYTPAARRVRGYYALPMLWRGRVIGWANAAVRDGRLVVAPGYVARKRPRDAGFRRALQDEQQRLARFLGL